MQGLGYSMATSAQYRGRPYRVTFQLQNYNDQLQKVSNDAKLKWLNEGIAFDLDLR